MTHFLDESGNIPKLMPREARELASFFALVIDISTKINPSTLTAPDTRCFVSGCQGLIKSEILRQKDEIHWRCSKCQNEGRISHWKGTKWNNIPEKKS
jgi:hypothetical protein